MFQLKGLICRGLCQVGRVQVFINSVVSEYVFDITSRFRIGNGFNEYVHILDAAKTVEPGTQYFGPGIVGDQYKNSIPLMFPMEVVKIPDSQADVDLRLEQDLFIKGLARIGPSE